MAAAPVVAVVAPAVLAVVVVVIVVVLFLLLCVVGFQLLSVMVYRLPGGHHSLLQKGLALSHQAPD